MNSQQSLSGPIKFLFERSTRRLTISTSQVQTIFQRILDFVICVIVFLLSMAFVLWLMTVLDPSYFANWFLP